MSLLKTKDRQPRNFEEFRLVIQPPPPPELLQKKSNEPPDEACSLFLLVKWLYPMTNERREQEIAGLRHYQDANRIV